MALTRRGFTFGSAAIGLTGAGLARPAIADTTPIRFGWLAALTGANSAPGIGYNRGVLYAGLMLPPTGAKVLEFNARFGDPETQAILPRLGSDALDLLDRSARFSGLADASIDWTGDWAVTVVLASRGYPESSSSGDVIEGLDAAEAMGAEVTHAGTAEEDGQVVTAGGRVLNVTALGTSPGEARERAYAAAREIHFEGMQMRTDIAARAVERVGA